VDFTKDQLIDALRRLMSNPNELIEFYYGADCRQTVIAKIRFQNTHGGMQFSLRIVSERGEGSGIYYPPDCLEEVAEYGMCFAQTRSKSLPVGYASVSHLFEIRFRLAPNYYTLGVHSFDPDAISDMKDAEVITLTLPEQTK